MSKFADQAILKSDLKSDPASAPNQDPAHVRSVSETAHMLDEYQKGEGVFDAVFKKWKR